MSSVSGLALRPKRGALVGPFGFVTQGGDHAFKELAVGDTLTVGSQMAVPTALVQNLLSNENLDVVSTGPMLIATENNLSVAVGGNLETLVDGAGGSSLLATAGPLVLASALGSATFEAGAGVNVRSLLGPVSISAGTTLLASGPLGVAVESDVAVAISAPDIIFNGNVVLNNLNVCGVSCPLGNFDVDANLAYFSGDVVVNGALKVCDLECAGDLTLNALNMTVPNDVSVGGNLYANSLSATSGRLELSGPLGVRTDRLLVTNVLQVSNLAPAPNATSVSLASGDLQVVAGNLNVASGGSVYAPAVRSLANNLQLLAPNVVANGNVVVGGSVRTPTIDPLGGNLLINASAVVNGSLQIVGAFQINGALDTCGVNCNSGTLLLSAPNGNVEFSSPNAVADGNLAVAGNVRVGGVLRTSALESLNVGDNVTLSVPAGTVVLGPGNLEVSSGSLSVGGTTDLVGGASVGGLLQANSDLSVLGNASVLGNLDACKLTCNNVGYALYSAGNLALNGNLILQSPGALTVAGDAAVNGVLTVQNVGRNGVSLVLGVGGNANLVSGNLVVGAGSLNVFGAANLTGNLTVNNVQSFAGTNLRLVSSNVVAAANLNVGGRLGVAGPATLTDANFSNSINVTHNVTADNLFVTGSFVLTNLVARNVFSDVGPLRLVANAASANVSLEPGTGGNVNVVGGNLTVASGSASVSGNVSLGQNLVATSNALRLVSANATATGNLAVNLSLNVGGQGVFNTNLATPQILGPVGGGNLSVSALAGNLLLSASGGAFVNVSETAFSGNVVALSVNTDVVRPSTVANVLSLFAGTVQVPYNVNVNLSTPTPSADRVLYYNPTPGRFVDGGAYGQEFLQGSQSTSFGPIFKTATNPLPPAGPSYYGSYANVAAQFTVLTLSGFSSSAGSVSTYNAGTGVLTLNTPVGSYYSGSVSAMLDTTLLMGEALQVGMLYSLDAGATWRPYAFSNAGGSTSGGANTGISSEMPVAFATAASPQGVLFVARVVNSAGAPIQNLTGDYLGLRFALKLGS